MAIKSIRVSNFKSFSDTYVELGKFNVLIGANASGKSNFVQIFKFLRDISNYGLENAISLQGGVEYLRNINICSTQDMTIEIIFDREFRRIFEKNKKDIGLKVYETIYRFSIKFNKKGLGFKIIKDELIQKCEILKLESSKNKKVIEKEVIFHGEIVLIRSNKKVKFSLKNYQGNTIPIDKEDFFPSLMTEEEMEAKMLLLETPLFFFIFPPFYTFFRGISIYDFDPKLPKKATPITGKAELEEDGSNLAIVLKNIIENDEKKRKISNFLKELLPFISDLDIEKFADKSLIFKLSEIYANKCQYMPASLLSDGTINITALIVALYFEEKSFAIIEEPERNIHPYLISKVVAMMKEASNEKQIITTTHNHEMVKHADLEEILFISRNEDGFSTISRPSEQSDVKTFIENDIGIEELYVQNLLGA
ncbi:MAG: AAA family ATPase [Phormidium sp.]